MPEPEHYGAAGGRSQPGAARLPPHAGRRSRRSVVVGEASDGHEAVAAGRWSCGRTWW